MTPSSRVTDRGIEQMVSVLLRTGVLLSGAVVVAGAIYFLLRHHAEPADFSHFHGEPLSNRSLHGIIAGAISLRARSIIQAGILMLIATPVLRVVFSLIGFAMERDRAFVVITAVVLCALLVSLISGAAGG